ncbi:hypothetical protein O1L60_29280 [Streptomyces diastatochromogenes]|nr:hypothetical protein [Streptomyces diastatochromogenes]
MPVGQRRHGDAFGLQEQRRTGHDHHQQHLGRRRYEGADLRQRGRVVDHHERLPLRGELPVQPLAIRFGGRNQIGVHVHLAQQSQQDTRRIRSGLP